MKKQEVKRRRSLEPMIDNITQRILFIRGEKVMLDSDLAKRYDVESRVLIQAVKRNIGRFPRYFMFQLTKKEVNELMPYIVTSSSHGGRDSLSYVHTE